MIIDKLINKQAKTPAQVVIRDVVCVKKGERVLIISNPNAETSEIAQNLFEAARDAGATATLMYQDEKTSFDNANPEVIAAIKSEPDVCFSISSQKLGKDPEAAANPYKTEDGREYHSTFDYLLDGKKTMRGVWTPGINLAIMEQSVAIDYKTLQNRCESLKGIFEKAESIKVTAPGGTDIVIPVKNRVLMSDDGDFSKPGTGGNIPAGEVFISPLVGGLKNPDESVSDGCEGTIVFDGSMTFSDGDAMLETPITCTVEKGYVTEVTGGAEAKRLLKSITEAETRAVQYEREKKLPEGMGEVYKKNARNIGELGIGLNPSARIIGNMLQDEKAFNTCHFAIGENYDNDAPSLIHLDGIVRNPTIVITYEDGTTAEILKGGILNNI